MKKWGLITLIFLCAFSGYGQDLVPMHRDVWERYGDQVNRVGEDFHSDVKPWIRKELMSMPDYDSIPVLGLFERDTASQSGSYLAFYPMADLSFGADLTDTSGNPIAASVGLGLGLDAQITEKLHLNADWLYKQASYASYVDSVATHNYILPGEGLARVKDGHYELSQFNATLAWQAAPWLHLQVGQGRNFLGDGYRSLFLSDNHYSYPHARITTDVWRIKYVNLFMMTRNVVQSGGDRSKFRNRFSTIHYLTWNATRRLNFSLFEVVIWQGQDEGVSRGLDWNYLNPVIFYRPVEFSVGSADNSLLGFGYKVKINDHSKIYGQVLLDEFVSEFVREDFRQFYNRRDTVRNGWWANKYAIQMGWNSTQLFGKKEWSFRTEINWVRPFTYTHGTLTQNYAHFGEPMAHPLGANFFEWTNILRYERDRLMIENRFQRAVWGGNPSVLDNYGGDLFVPYNNRVREFENFTGQGIQHLITFNQLRATWLLDSDINLRIEGSFLFRANKTDFDTHYTTLFQLGVRTALHNRYRDF